MVELQQIVTWLIVATAGGYLVGRAWRVLSGRGGGCGTCGGCGTKPVSQRLGEGRSVSLTILADAADQPGLPANRAH